MINKKHIESIPLKGDIKFREKKIESENTALLIIDVQKGEWRSFRIENILDFAIVRPQDLDFQVETNVYYTDVPF